ncbi:hypothetical protein DFH06DRAFT_356927 [Mycena polygramma]|nr:hypothetical protein DFH06DRAFT_356927 [Mycena polygramma]
MAQGTEAAVSSVSKLNLRIPQLSVPAMDECLSGGNTIKFIPTPIGQPVGSSDTAVSAGTLFFLRGLNQQQQSDTLNSFLLAQLSADHKYPKADTEKDVTRWYTHLGNTLGEVGWIIQSFEFTKVALQKSAGTVGRSALETLTQDPNITKEQLGSFAQAVLKFVEAGPESNATQVFDEKSLGSSKKWATFMICIASVDGGDVVLSCYAAVFSSSEALNHVLSYSWDNKEVNMTKALQTLTLNESVYDIIREQVKEKLQGQEKFIVNL